MKLFSKYDKDKSGSLDREECLLLGNDLAAVVKKHGDFELDLDDETLKKEIEKIINIIFYVADEDNSGSITKDEFQKVFQNFETIFRLSKMDVHSVDIIIDGNFDNFMKKPGNANEIEAIFFKYDKDGSGTINHDELESFSKDYINMTTENKSDEEKILAVKWLCNSVMHFGDTDKDGTLTLDEFKAAMEKIDDVVQKYSKDVKKELKTLRLIKEADFNVLVSNLENVDQLKGNFRKYDKSGNGKLSLGEMQLLCGDMFSLLCKDQLATGNTDTAKAKDFASIALSKIIFKESGKDDNAEMDFEEFKAMLAKLNTLKEEYLKLIHVSIENTKLLAKANFQSLVKVEDQAWKAIFMKYDKDGDGRIDGTELVSFAYDFNNYFLELGNKILGDVLGRFPANILAQVKKIMGTMMQDLIQQRLNISTYEAISIDKFQATFGDSVKLQEFLLFYQQKLTSGELFKYL